MPRVALYQQRQWRRKRLAPVCLAIALAVVAAMGCNAKEARCAKSDRVTYIVMPPFLALDHYAEWIGAVEMRRLSENSFVLEVTEIIQGESRAKNVSLRLSEEATEALRDPAYRMIQGAAFDPRVESCPGVLFMGSFEVCERPLFTGRPRHCFLPCGLLYADGHWYGILPGQTGGHEIHLWVGSWSERWHGDVEALKEEMRSRQ